ncbi:F-box only protein 7 [Collichthys lucidus]|uniref:F-box only protein 7 n=1 Tax=Collichthys lucidus TaxID=240159 RepID=A0A4U5VPE9_COLLU|nr:F-box only protein 7 [Collichthys lucidus]
MKLRVRISRQTSRVELPGAEPSVKELLDHVRDTVLPSHGLSADTRFSLSLNGSEVLTDSGQTLSSCGIVSGDLICVVLAEPANANQSSTNTNANQSSTNTNQSSTNTNANQSSTNTNANESSTNNSTSANTPSSSTENQRTEQNQQTTDMTSNQTSADPLDSAGPSGSSWEPMLCSEAEDGQAPLSLDLLYHSAQTASPSDAIMVAGHQLMLETGFLPQGSELQPADMPAGWRLSAGLYKLQYTHPLCEHSLAMVLSVCMGPVLVINATLKVNQTVDVVRKLCLNPSTYVTDEWPGGSAAAAFKDLNKLSRIFKDQLAYPLIAAAREAMALPVVFGLAALPPELLLRVLRLLDVCSVLRLSAVCRRFNAATADSTLWRHLYRRDFTDSDPSRPRDTDWRELYKRSHKRRDLRPSARAEFDGGATPVLRRILGGAYEGRDEMVHDGATCSMEPVLVILPVWTQGFCSSRCRSARTKV